MKFSNKLSLAVFLSGAIVLIISSLTIYKLNYNFTIQSQFKQVESIANEVSEDINQQLHEKIKTALTLANTPLIKESLEKSNFAFNNPLDEKIKASIKRLDEKWKSIQDPGDSFILQFTDNKVARFLKSQQTLLKDEYGEIFLTNKFGALTASTAKLTTFAHGHKYWWLGSYNHGEGAVFFDDRGYDDSAGGYVLGLVVPVKKGKEIIGILKCNLNVLGSISQLLSSTQYKSIDQHKLIRSGGMIIFEKGVEPLSSRVNNSTYKKLENKNFEPFITSHAGEKHIIGFSEIQLTRGEKGAGFGGTFKSIDHKKGNTGESWYILSCRHMDIAIAPVKESIKSTIWVGIIILVVLVFVSQLFGRKIAIPLAKLNKATQRIGNGDFEYKINNEANDEFGHLARSFNSMAEKLRETTTSIRLLRKSEKRYTSLLDGISKSGILLFIVDDNYRVKYMNEPMIESFGNDKGKLCYEIMNRATEPCSYCKIKKVIDNKEIVQYESTIADGRIFSITAIPYTDVDGALCKLEIIQDITSRKKLDLCGEYLV